GASAFLAGFSFFCFFLRPTTGACSSSLVEPARASEIPFVASLRCLRCWLFVVVRTAADPTIFDGGGELARELGTEADTIDALSLMTSLGGVPGREMRAAAEDGILA